MAQIEAALWVVDRPESRPPQQIPISIQIGRFKCSLTCSFVALYWLQPVKWPSIAATKGALMVVGRLIGGSTNWVLKSEATYKGGEACLQASTDMDGRCKLGGALPS